MFKFGQDFYNSNKCSILGKFDWTFYNHEADILGSIIVAMCVGSISSDLEVLV